MTHPAERDPDRPDHGASVGARIRGLRAAQGMSLSELARRAGLGKATLSELEAGRRNPTLDTLYALTAPLGIGLASLLVDRRAGGAALQGAHPEISGSGVNATLLDVVPGAHGAVLEVYRLQIDPGPPHHSPGHGTGVREQLTLAAGRARVGPPGAEQEIRPGRTASWSSDGPHSYVALDHDAAIGVLIITYPDQPA